MNGIGQQMTRLMSKGKEKDTPEVQHEIGKEIATEIEDDIEAKE